MGVRTTIARALADPLARPAAAATICQELRRQLAEDPAQTSYLESLSLALATTASVKERDEVVAFLDDPRTGPDASG